MIELRPIRFGQSIIEIPVLQISHWGKFVVPVVLHESEDFLLCLQPETGKFCVVDVDDGEVFARPDAGFPMWHDTLAEAVKLADYMMDEMRMAQLREETASLKSKIIGLINVDQYQQAAELAKELAELHHG